MAFIDTHSHLDSFIGNSTIDDVLARASSVGVSRIITCSTTPEDWLLYSSLARTRSDIVSWMIGVHPTEIKESHLDALDALSSYFIDGIPPLAIGEIGLDYHYFSLTNISDTTAQAIDLQKKIFRRQLSIAADLNLKVCVHARDSIDDCIEEIAATALPFENVVFHCFSGSAAQLQELNALGARASFTGIITYKSAQEMRDAMLAQGLERLMLETDCPYLAPVPKRGAVNEPSFIPLIYSSAAKIFDVKEDYLIDRVEENCRSFFNL